MMGTEQMIFLNRPPLEMCIVTFCSNAAVRGEKSAAERGKESVFLAASIEFFM